MPLSPEPVLVRATTMSVNPDQLDEMMNVAAVNLAETPPAGVARPFEHMRRVPVSITSSELYGCGEYHLAMASAHLVNFTIRTRQVVLMYPIGQKEVYILLDSKGGPAIQYHGFGHVAVYDSLVADTKEAPLEVELRAGAAHTTMMEEVYKRF